jgi:gliding motility-associated-like protein
LTRTTPPSAFDLQLTECEVPPSGGPVTATVLLTDYENTVTFLPAASREITWYKESRVVNPSQTNVVTGQVYNAKIRDTGTGCSSDARVTFTVRPLPKVTDAVASLCEDVPGSNTAAGVDLNQDQYRSMVTAESNVDITWYLNESDARLGLSPVTAPLNISGTSQVYARVAYNSELPRCYDISTLSLIVNSSPSNTEIFGREAVCQGDPDRLSIEIYQVVPVNGARYYWEIPTADNEFKVYGGGKETDFFVLLQFPNIYEGKIKVRVELNGCSGPVLEKNVSVTPSSVAPVINGDTLVCESSHNVTFSVSPNNFPSSSYQWEVRKASDNSTGGAYIVNGQSTGNILVDFLEEDVILSVRESNSVCVSPAATQMIRITQNPEVSAVLHKAVTFFQGADGAIRAEVAGGHPPFHEYKLLPDNIVDLDHDGIFHNLDAGSYSIQVTDSEGCADTSEPFILDQGAPVTGPDADAVFKATPAAACAPVSIEIQNESQGADIYSWKVYRGGVLVTESALKDPVFRIVDAGTYEIQLMVHSSSTGQKDSASLSGIEVYPVPLASFRVSSTPVYAPDTELQPLNDSEGANQYQWNFGDGFTTSEFEPAHAYSQAGNYTIELIASHDYGSKDLDGDGVPDSNVVCYDTTRHGVVALDGGVIEIPNAFTPSLQGPSGGVDQGGINDVFIPRTKDVAGYSMQIFNRWGTLIFESRDVNIGWDGYDQDGKLMPAGVYIYKFVLSLPDGQRTTRVGDVSLLR